MKAPTILIVITVLMMSIGVKTFGSQDTKYYYKFKGTGKISSEGGHDLPNGEDKDPKEFFGVMKRVIYKDKGKGTDLFFLVWEEEKKTWSPGFYFGSTGVTTQEMAKKKNFQSTILIRHFGS